MKILIFVTLLFTTLNNNTPIGTWEVYKIDYAFTNSSENPIKDVGLEQLIREKLGNSKYIFEISNDSMTVYLNGTLLDKVKINSFNKTNFELPEKKVGFEMKDNNQSCNFNFDNIVMYARKINE